MNIKIKTFLLLIFVSSALNAQTYEEGLRAIESDKYEGAKHIFQELIKKDPSKSSDYYYQLGNVYIALFKNDSAMISFNKGIEVDKSNGTNFAGLGQLKLSEDKAQEAMNLFNQALAAKKKSVKTNRAIAYAYLSAGEKYLDVALQYADAAMALDNKDVENYVLLGDIYLEKKGEAGKAATNYERGIEVDPKDPKPLVKVANIWLRVGNASATLESLNKALALDSNYAPAHKTLSKLYYRSQQYNNAKAEYNKFLDLSERSDANLRQYANILFLADLHKEALPILEQLIVNKFNDINLYRLKAYSMYEIGKEEKIDSIPYYQEAVKSLEYFLNNAPKSKIITSDYTYLGKTLSKAGEDSLAIETLKKVLVEDSTNAELLNEIAMIYYTNRNYMDAAIYFQKSIDNKSRPSVLDYFYVGRSYLNTSQYGKADTAYAKMIELKPDYYDAYLSRGNANAAMDTEYKDTVAKNMFEKYIELTKNETEKYKKGIISSYIYLAVYAVQNNDNKNGIIYLKKVLELDPKNETALVNLKQLQQK